MAAPALRRRRSASNSAGGHCSPVSGLMTARSTPSTGLPSAPLGMPSTGLMAAPPSLCAVALNEVAPEALAEAVAVAHRCFGAECADQGVVGVVRPLGRGQDVGDCFSDVTELGGAEVAYVVDEGRRAEARAGWRWLSRSSPKAPRAPSAHCRGTAAWGSSRRRRARSRSRVLPPRRCRPAGPGCSALPWARRWSPR